MPLHAPVALDGRWITNIQASATTHVSTVTLAAPNILLPNELIGCELRVAYSDSGPPATYTFLAGTVISHLGATVKIRDQGHTIATAWQGGHLHKPSACFYDIREGYYKGVIGSSTTGTHWFDGQNLPCTFITVNGALAEAPQELQLRSEALRAPSRTGWSRGVAQAERLHDAGLAERPGDWR